MKEKLENMAQLVNEAIKDVEKFEGGNNAAGTRIRKAMQALKISAQEVRVTVSEIKNANKAE